MSKKIKTLSKFQKKVYTILNSEAIFIKRLKNINNVFLYVYLVIFVVSVITVISCIPFGKTKEIKKSYIDFSDNWYSNNEQVNLSEIYKYDKIFVTDLCLEEPVLSKIAKDEKLKGKLLNLDHHITYLNEKYTKIN